MINIPPGEFLVVKKEELNELMLNETLLSMEQVAVYNREQRIHELGIEVEFWRWAFCFSIASTAATAVIVLVFG